MKKRKCGFRQKLGIVLAAGMIISNMNFAVLPVSATEDSSTGSETSVDLDVQAVVEAINDLPALDDIKSRTAEELTAIYSQVDVISKKIDALNIEQNLPADAAKTFEDIKNYLAELGIQTAEENGVQKGSSTELSADDKANLVKAVADHLAAEIKKVATGTQQSTRFDVLALIQSYGNDEAACNELDAKQQELLQSLLLNCQNDLFWFDKSSTGALTFSKQYLQHRQFSAL